MLEESQATLDDNILEDRSWWDIDGGAFVGDNDDGTLESDITSKVNGTSDGQVVQLQDSWDGWNAALEVGNLLEVGSELDKRSWSEAGAIHGQLSVLEGVQIRLDEHEIGGSLDWQEAATRNVNTVAVLEVTDGSTDGSLELEDRDVGLALSADRNGLLVWNDLELELAILDNALDGLQAEPDVVGVEVLELLDGLELLDMVLADLGNFKESDGSLIVNDGTTLNISLGLVGQFHNILGFSVDHVLQNAWVDGSSQVVNVGQEEVLNTVLEEPIESSRVVERLENVTVSWWVPVGDWRIKGLWNWEERILEDTWVSGLVEGADINLVSLVLLDDVLSVIVGVEGVHEDEWNVDVVLLVEVLDLTNGQIEERHAIANLNDRLWTDATHGGTKTTVELEDRKLAKDGSIWLWGEVIIGNDLVSLWWRNAVPVPAMIS
jgi:hypothetical protein